MKALQIFVSLLALFITLPLAFYQGWLLYKHVHATDLMWFLLWLNWPITVLISVITKITTKIISKD